MAGALLDPTPSTPPSQAWFAAEQRRVHAGINRVWPRRLGTTPRGMADAIGAYGVRYAWRRVRRADAFADVERAVRGRRPVAMLIGNVVPRHWVLVIGCDGDAWECYEPSSGQVRRVSPAAVRAARLVGLGFPRAFAFVLPRSNI
ncbi:hypothetical protein [Mycobacterium sp. NPDC006124]|uniref:hypothetical protein n=1 Tax=Mycobacterium sp. NPDC006124 TaxID=3156729 RepID=UPI0033B8C959